MASKQVEPPTPSEIFSKYRGPLPSGPVLDSGIEDGMDWEEYEGIEKNTEEAGTIHYTYEEDADHGISQYSIRPDGYERTLYKDGRRAQLNVDGSVLEIHPDGRKIQINPNGDRMEKLSNGIELCTYENGAVTLSIQPDGEKVQRDSRTGVEQHIFPDGRSIQINPDGSKVEKMPNGSITKVTATGEVKHIKELANGQYEVIDPEVVAAEARRALEQKRQKQVDRIEAEKSRREARKRGGLEDDHNESNKSTQPVGMSFMSMKKQLKQSGVVANRVDQCLDKHELEKLAQEFSVSLMG